MTIPLVNAVITAIDLVRQEHEKFNAEHEAIVDVSDRMTLYHIVSARRHLARALSDVMALPEGAMEDDNP